MTRPRGIELSSTDLLKNYLFSLFQGPDDLQEAQRQWRRIIKTVQMETFPDFLRYYLSLRQPRVRRRVFKVVRDSVKDGQQAFELLNQLENYSDLFVALGNANDEFWRDTPDNRPYIGELKLFQVKQAYPTLFAAHERFAPRDFTRLLKLVSVFSFRYTIVSSLNPSELETLYSQVAIAITNGQINKPRQVFDHLHSVYVSDEKFLQDFSLLSIPTKGQKKNLARYILGKLEADSSGILIDEDGFSIEHILPESPSSSWQQNFTASKIEEMVDRLGNLTPLEPDLNNQIGSKSYQIKQAAYKKSVYQLAKNITAEEWTPETLTNRQKKLAQQAVQVWRSDFST